MAQQLGGSVYTIMFKKLTSLVNHKMMYYKLHYKYFCATHVSIFRAVKLTLRTGKVKAIPRELVRQPKTAIFRPKSKHEYIVDRFSKC